MSLGVAWTPWFRAQEGECHLCHLPLQGPELVTGEEALCKQKDSAGRLQAGCSAGA